MTKDTGRTFMCFSAFCVSPSVKALFNFPHLIQYFDIFLLFYIYRLSLSLSLCLYICMCLSVFKYMCVCPYVCL